MRKILFEWLIEVSNYFNFREETYFKTILLIDKML